VGIYLVLADGTYQSFGMYLVYFLLVVSSYDILPILDTVESKLYSTAAVLGFCPHSYCAVPVHSLVSCGRGLHCVYVHTCTFLLSNRDICWVIKMYVYVCIHSRHIYTLYIHTYLRVMIRK